MTRHARGDWGNVPPDDATANDAAAAMPTGMVMSVYTGVASATDIWVITSAMRRTTTVMLPSEH